jgi:hypothetical protein
MNATAPTKGDQLVERGSQKLHDLAGKAAARGGLAAKLSQPLIEDAAFLRKLKPSLIKARARGGEPTETTPLQAPAGVPVLAEAQERKHSGADGNERSPFPLIGAALCAGIAVAKLVDWRGHAHPRD